jgi:hypothetical protein
MFKSKKKRDQQKVDAFFAEYRALAYKHGFDFYAALQATERGVIPVIKVRALQNEAGSQ